MNTPLIPASCENGPDLRWRHTALLRLLDEHGGFTAGTLGKEVWSTADGRSAASSATPALKALERWGLATRLDGDRPVIWIRTPAGTKILSCAAGIPVREIAP